MRAARRLAIVFGVAALVGIVARLRGKAPAPVTTGGWRPLEGPEFR